MRKDIAEKLLRINLEFYQTFAEAFSDTRRRLQPGVLRAILAVSDQASVLDLGCGAGDSLAAWPSAAGARGGTVLLPYMRTRCG
ncbi:MAG TPA: hypothetical protein VJK02_22510 [Anaerolineales bacterium]|nr:hypothetical protein [Anaerolineales bacterium]